MRHLHAVLLAACAGFSLPAAAQSGVQLFGIVDMGIEYARTGPDRDALRVESGLLQTSRFGLRGTEDLGGGLKGLFLLEAGVSADTGAFQDGGFGRQAWVGIESGFGALTLGRQYTPGYYTFLDHLPFGHGLGGKASNLAIGQATRHSNAVVYRSPAFAGFSGRLMFAAGDERFAEPAQAGRVLAGSLHFARGPLSGSVAYHDQQGAAFGTPAVEGRPVRQLVAGATYNFGVFSLSAGGYDREGATAANAPTRVRARWFGGKAAVGRGEVLAQVARIDDRRATNRDATLSSVAYLHPLSRRTSLYANFTVMANNANASYGIAGAGNEAPDASVRTAGYDAKSLMLGVRHTF